jgi:hypothetical protein
MRELLEGDKFNPERRRSSQRRLIDDKFACFGLAPVWRERFPIVFVTAL